MNKRLEGGRNNQLSPLPSVKPPPVSVGITASVPVLVEGESGGGRTGWRENGFGGKFLEGRNEIIGLLCFDSKKINK